VATGSGLLAIEPAEPALGIGVVGPTPATPVLVLDAVELPATPPVVATAAGGSTGSLCAARELPVSPEEQALEHASTATTTPIVSLNLRSLTMCHFLSARYPALEAPSQPLEVPSVCWSAAEPTLNQCQNRRYASMGID
jgi:hypothetical protein